QPCLYFLGTIILRLLNLRFKQRSEKFSHSLNKGANEMQTITITHSPRGYKLQEPITIAVPETKNAADEKLQQYLQTISIYGSDNFIKEGRDGCLLSATENLAENTFNPT
ncbi:MAG: hypothetical protein P8017_14275, partial [Deltaproteobacteria bacterium]